MIMLNQAGAKITNIKNASLSNDSESDKIDDEVEMPEKRSDEKKDKDTKIQKPSGSEDEKIRRVFITHGKNKEFVEPIKQLLKFGELEAVVAVDNQSVSKPVSAKVMDDMRSCKAAIIHVDEERRLMDTEGKEHIILNNNVLIEIGAAMALYGGRYILLVKDGITLPTNLQGLYQVRYTGNKLDGDATINLMKAINSMKQDKLEAAA
jgi:predicted nucleotide-binding protein